MLINKQYFKLAETDHNFIINRNINKVPTNTIQV